MVTPITPAAVAKSSAAPPPVQPPVAAHAGAVRTGVANTLRAVGAGVDHASELIAVEADKGYIRPIEALYSASTAIKNATQNKSGLVKKVGGVGSKAFGVGGFVSAFYSMIVGGILRAPGDVVGDVARSVADKIDGSKTFDGTIGPGIAPTDAAIGAAATTDHNPAVVPPAPR